MTGNDASPIVLVDAGVANLTEQLNNLPARAEAPASGGARNAGVFGSAGDLPADDAARAAADNHVAVLQIVFIDYDVADLQDLLNGMQPGTEAFVLGPGTDGLGQIADILAANNLSDLTSISIVAHGSDGEMQLGSTLLSEANLTSNAAALAAIGAALQPGGGIQLYSRDVAQGAPGQQFIDDFSTLAGGVPVAASTHLAGDAGAGGSWRLDAASGEARTRQPFAARALASYHGEPSGAGGGDPDGQLWAADTGASSGNPDGQSDARVEHMDSDGLANDQVDAYNITSTLLIQSVGLDTAANLYFAEDNLDNFYVGHISTGANLTKTTIASTSDSDVTNAFIVDPAKDTIFMDLDGGDYTADGGDIIEITYNPATGVITSPYNPSTFAINLNKVLLDSTSSGKLYQDGRAFALSSDGSTLYYVDDDDNNSGGAFSAATNGIYKVGTTGDVGQGTAPTPALLSLQSQFPTNDSNGYITGIAVNEAQGLIYFTTDSTAEGVNTTQNAIWYMPIAGGVLATEMSLPGVSLEYPAFFGENMAFDPVARTLYVTDTGRDAVIQLTLSADGKSFTSGNNDFYTVDTNSGDGADDTNALTFASLASESGASGTSTDALQGGTAVTLLTAVPTIDDPQGSYIGNLAGVIVEVIGGTRGNGTSFGVTAGSLSGAAGLSGDELFVNGQQSGTLDGGLVTVAWNNATQTLTLSGDVSDAEYQTLLSEITFQENANTDNTSGGHPTRVIDFIANDGVTVDHPTTSDPNEQTVTLTIDRAPTANPDSANVVEGATVSVTSAGGVLPLASDLDNDTLTVATVSVSGGASGTVGSPLSGTYGTLTLSSNGSFSYTASDTSAINAAGSGRLTDDFTYTVSDGHGGSSTVETLDIAVDRPPVQTTHSASVLSGGTIPATPLGDSDPDSDGLTVVGVSVSGGASGTVGSPLSGTYGTLTISSNDAYTYSANDAAAINAAGSGPLTDDFTYTVSDGHGGTTVETLDIAVDRPPVQVTHSSSVLSGGSVSASSPIDSDLDGNTLTVTAVSVSGGITGTVGSPLAGHYGTLTISSNDTYTYSANDAAAINAAASGSHPVDAFTYTVSDGHGGSTVETLDITIDRPLTVSNVPTSATASAGGATILGPTISGADPDSFNLTSATVVIVGGTSGDVLSASTTGAITMSYSSAAKTLTLSGPDTSADFNQVLDTVTFRTTGAGGSRTIGWTIFEGGAQSTVQDETLIAFGAPTWSAGSGDWDTAADWSTGVVPTGFDDGTIATAGTVTVTHNSGTAETVDSLLVGGNDTVAFTSGALSVSNGLTNSGTFDIGSSGITTGVVISAAALVNAGGMVITGDAAAQLLIAGSAGDTGSITLHGSSLLSAGNGLTISAGGALTVQNGGTVLGGVVVTGGSVFDSGYIAGAITLASGAYLQNAATISAAGDAVFGITGPNTVVNSGTISGTGVAGVGIYLAAGGSVTNAFGGQIDGGAIGVDAVSGAPTVVNSGLISGATCGIFLSAGGTIVDAGTIVGSAGVAAQFAGNSADLLVLEAGYKLVGTVSGSTTAGATNTLELAGAPGNAVTANYNTLGLSNFQDVLFGPDGAATLDVSNTTGQLPLTISGFTTTTDIIDLTQIGTNGTITSINTIANTVTISGALGTVALQFSGANLNELTTLSDGAGGTDVQLPPSPDDFTGGGMSDIIWQFQDGGNSADPLNGNASLWLMNGSTPVSEPLVAAPGANWQVVGAGDFGNAQADLVWQYENSTSPTDPLNGDTSIWLMNGSQETSGPLIATPGANWHVVATGDFGNAQADIVWQYENSASPSDPDNGYTALWLMNGSNPTSGPLIATPGANWHVVATGDFGNDQADLVWQYENSANPSDSQNGNVSIWLMHGATPGSEPLIAAPGASWHVVGTGYFGNGQSDLLWQYEDSANPADPLNGETSIWLMSGTNEVSGPLIASPGASWHAIATGDFTGSGQSDILWQYENSANPSDPNNGMASIWLMNGTQQSSGPLIAAPGANWHVTA